MAVPDEDFVLEWTRLDPGLFDESVPTLIEAATDMANHETGRDFRRDEMPYPVQCWVAAQVAHWINNPTGECKRDTMVSPFLARLLDPYRLFR